jgi:23S rRNA (adenine2503-C2)-methyltransferase
MNKLKIIKTSVMDNLSKVFIAELEEGRLIEFVESVQPPRKISEKWVLIISTLAGCPVKCLMCDAGYYFKGKLSKEEMIAQIEYLVKDKFPSSEIKTEMLKIQFARLGEPAMNINVIDVLKWLPVRYEDINILPSVSSIAPKGFDLFFEKLIEVRQNLYSDKDFQMQFSIHTTDVEKRNKIIPVRKMTFEEMAVIGKKMYKNGFRKIALNFALMKDSPLEVSVLKKYFSPELFMLKITPVNPTYSKLRNEVESFFNAYEEDKNYLIDEIKSAGYDVILSIGEKDENLVGSNCGQFIVSHLNNDYKLCDGYTNV